MDTLSIERTSEAIVIKLPLDLAPQQLQHMLDYFTYVESGSKGSVTQELIDELAKEAKAGWWEKNKHRFVGQEGFEDVM